MSSTIAYKVVGHRGSIPSLYFCKLFLTPGPLFKHTFLKNCPQLIDELPNPTLKNWCIRYPQNHWPEKKQRDFMHHRWPLEQVKVCTLANDNKTQRNSHSTLNIGVGYVSQLSENGIFLQLGQWIVKPSQKQRQIFPGERPC